MEGSHRPLQAESRRPIGNKGAADVFACPDAIVQKRGAESCGPVRRRIAL